MPTVTHDNTSETLTPAGQDASVSLRTCLACGTRLAPHTRIPSGRLNEVFNTAELRELVPVLHYGRCRECGSIWATDGRRNEQLLARIYAALPDTYWTKLSGDQRSFRRWDDLAQRHGRGRVLCDVGCGDGKLLEAISSRWDKHGLDPGPGAVAICRARGLNVSVGTPATSGVAKCYDVITCIDTLEHMLDPRAEIEAMMRMLRPDGILLIVTGDAGTWTARLAGPWWEYLHCVGHVSVLSRRALLTCLTRAGLNAIRQDTVSHYAGVKLGPWLLELTRNYWRRARGYRYRHLRYCRDHQIIVARKS